MSTSYMTSTASAAATKVRFDAVTVGTRIRLIRRATATVWTVTGIERNGRYVNLSLRADNGVETTSGFAAGHAGLFLA